MNPPRYVGNPDFHDGYIRTVSRSEDRLVVVVEGFSGKRYKVSFDGVSEVDSLSPQDMMLYALAEADLGTSALHHYNFINWYCDEPDEEESKAYLKIVARSFAVTQAQ
ncbi:MAG: hypothetical protein ABSG51_14465 [Terracidiphilus sp.]|jgi:hypothetical protein